jgi:hypothetical protein
VSQVCELWGTDAGLELGEVSDFCFFLNGELTVDRPNVPVAENQPETVQALQEGNVYRFSYSEQARERWRTDPYWCFDGQLVVRNGKLCDTYWSFGACGESRIVEPSEGTLTFVCNLNDVREIQEYEKRHYMEADVFDLTHHHGHRKRFVVRKGAEPSAERILFEIGAKEFDTLRQMEAAVCSAGRTLVQLGELRARVTTGDLSKKPWW